VALAIDHLVAHGVPREDAERQARARFGDYGAALCRLHVSARAREAQMDRRDLIEELRQDTRLALRLFRRSPAFFLAVALTFALGIGANGAAFSILQSGVLQPLPYRNPNEFVMLRRTNGGAVEWPSMRFAGGHALTSPMVLGWR
jgi:putative ABC transport system permease protein